MEPKSQDRAIGSRFMRKSGFRCAVALTLITLIGTIALATSHSHTNIDGPYPGPSLTRTMDFGFQAAANANAGVTDVEVEGRVFTLTDFVEVKGSGAAVDGTTYTGQCTATGINWEWVADVNTWVDGYINVDPYVNGEPGYSGLVSVAISFSDQAGTWPIWGDPDMGDSDSRWLYNDNTFTSVDAHSYWVDTLAGNVASVTVRWKLEASGYAASSRAGVLVNPFAEKEQCDGSITLVNAANGQTLLTFSIG